MSGLNFRFCSESHCAVPINTRAVPKSKGHKSSTRDSYNSKLVQSVPSTLFVFVHISIDQHR